MLNLESLQNKLRTIETMIDIHALAKDFNCNVDELLTLIHDSVMKPYKQIFKSNAFKLPFFKQAQIEDFYQQQIVDLGFLCQEKIKEFKETLADKHDNLAYQTMYNNWVLYRGY